MDFENRDQDQIKTAPEGGEFKPSLDEQLRVLGNRMQAQDAVEGAAEDAEGKDESDLSGSLDHAKLALLASGAMSSDMYSSLQALVHRAQERNERQEKQQVQINLIEDREEKKRKQEEDAEEEFEGSVDRVKAEEKRERERQEWAQSTHRFGTVEMTGEEWGEMATLLGKDTPLRRQMIERLMKKGKSKEEAEDIVDQAKRAGYLMSIPENQRTDEQKAELRKLEQDKDVQDVLEAAKKAKPALNIEADQGAKQAGQAISADAVADQLAEPAVSSGSGKLDAFNQATASLSATPKVEKTDSARNEDKAFASAPDLGEHYQRAVQATDPLDAEKPKPQQVAANDVKAAPQVAAPGSGFAV